MPRPTSDFRNPVCLEMKTLRSHFGNPYLMEASPPHYSAVADNGDVANNNNNNSSVSKNEMGSLDSSETFASCNTHPFQSQGSLSSDVADSNLYVNPMDKSTDNSPVQASVLCFGRGARAPPGVKKSASGDTALRSLGTSPLDEAFRGFGGLERGSRGSLNDSPLPKHRKTRFQQSVRPRTRCGDTSERPRFESQESLEGKKTRRASFMPARSLASATRIINQHLFGLQTIGGSRTGKNGSSKSSLSVDSIDSHASPQLETHRRSKSILKKSDSGHRNGRDDPESERLISDSAEFSPQRRPGTVLLKTLPPSGASAGRGLRSPLFLLDDIMAGDKRDKNLRGDPGLVAVGDVPLYICPPPPPMDDNSPTEETRLLLHQTPVPQHKQTANSTSKGAGLAS